MITILESILNSLVDLSPALIEQTLQSVYESTVAAFPLLAVILLINVLGQRWLKPRQLCFLWSLILLRLLVPWVPGSPVSLSHWVYGSPHVEENVPQDPILLDSELSGDLIPTPTYAPPVERSADLVESGLMLLTIMWIIGLIAIPGFAISRYGIFALRVMRNKQPADERLNRLWQACSQRAGIRLAVPIAVCDCVNQPAVMGIWRPLLLIPRDLCQLTDLQLEMVMLHELAHLRRHDIVANWMLLAVRTLHWWNPIYWIAATGYLSLREQVCDEEVFRTLSHEHRRTYGELLLQLVERPFPHRGWRVALPVALLSFLPQVIRKRSFKNRLLMIRKPARQQSRWQWLLVSGMIGMVTISGLTKAQEPMVPPEPPEPPAVPVPEIAANDSPKMIEPADDEPLTVIVYHVADLCQQIMAKDKLNERDAMKYLLFLSGSNLPAQKTLPEGELAVEGPANSQGNLSSIVVHEATRSLVVKASMPQHHRLQNMLEAWRTSGFAQIVIECRTITSAVDLSRKANLEWETFQSSLSIPHVIANDTENNGQNIEAATIYGRSVPVVTAHLSPVGLKRAMAVLQNDPKSNVMFAPKFTVFNGQEGRLHSEDARRFVTGLIKTESGGVSPQTTTVREGTKLTLLPIVNAESSAVRLRGTFDFTSVGEVRSVETMYAGQKRTIHSPQVNGCRVDVDAEVKNGHSFLIGLLPTENDLRYTYICLTPKILSEDDLRKSESR